MSTVTIELERNGEEGRFAVMYQVNWYTGGSWICATRELAEKYAKRNSDEVIDITERMIIYK